MSQDLFTRSKLTVEYLVNSILPDGKYLYEADLANHTVLPTYNIVRHFGSIYILYQWSRIYNDNSFLTKVETSIEFLKNFIKPLRDGELGLYFSEDENVKTGASALGLLMFIERYKKLANSKDLETMQGIATFLQWMQQPNGKFHSGFIIHYPYVMFSDFDSVYYPGQSILAFLRLYKIDNNTRWLNAAKQGIQYLLNNPFVEPDTIRGHNHWFVMALQEYLSLYPDEQIYNELALIVSETIRMIEKQSDIQGKINPRAFSSAAAGTRGEAIAFSLLSELQFNHTENFVRQQNVLKNVIEYCLTLQVTDSCLIEGVDVKGAFYHNLNNYNIRIDFAQHVLQAMMGWLTIDYYYKSLNRLKDIVNIDT